MESEVQYTSHSKISEFPPNPVLFPKFYNCEEIVYVLNPGDMLYIPPKWFHWVFSYENNDDIRENLAVSYNIFDSKDIYNEFYYREPFILTLDKQNHSFLDLSFDKLINYIPIDYKQLYFITKGKTIIPVKKNNENIQLKKMNITEVLEMYKSSTYNISIGQDELLPKYLNIDIPNIIKRSFPNSDVKTLLWLNLLKSKQSYIETGLHYDITHNILVQVKGTKVVRLYKPSNARNLYLQPMYARK